MRDSSETVRIARAMMRTLHEENYVNYVTKSHFFNLTSVYVNGMTYLKTDNYCPQCGEQSVMVEDSDGDYHDGPAQHCYQCLAKFYLKI